jgi:hypothetical protein
MNDFRRRLSLTPERNAPRRRSVPDFGKDFVDVRDRHRLATLRPAPKFMASS